jgi:hypothetical protein
MRCFRKPSRRGSLTPLSYCARDYTCTRPILSRTATSLRNPDANLSAVGTVWDSPARKNGVTILTSSHSRRRRHRLTNSVSPRIRNPSPHRLCSPVTISLCPPSLTFNPFQLTMTVETIAVRCALLAQTRRSVQLAQPTLLFHGFYLQAFPPLGFRVAPPAIFMIPKDRPGRGCLSATSQPFHSFL